MDDALPRATRTPIPASKRMAAYRARMRAAGLRPKQIWVPDTNSPEFIAKCEKAVAALSRHDPAGDELMEWIEQVYEWPE